MDNFKKHAGNIWNTFCVREAVKWLISSLGLLAMSCSANPHATNKGNQSAVVADTLIQIGGVKVLIKKPSALVPPAGTLLLLPGWNYSFTKWCDSSDVCQSALEKGFTVVAPDMGKSIYATQYFPETREDYRKYPTLTWLDTALNILKAKHKLFNTSGMLRNYVLGLSTGARGAALICAKKPGFFHAAALLSGDFNQAAMTDDALCTNVYGPYQQFSERWKNTDNPLQQVDQIITPMYIGHGGMDKVVHVTQSIEYHDSLLAKRKNVIMQQNARYVVQKQRSQAEPGYGIRLDPLDFLELNIAAPAGHNWDFWRSQLPAVWAFFEKR